MGGVFFDGWTGLVRVVLVGTAAYLWLVTVLRVTGKRTLAQLNAFDFVVTVALGSTLATVLLSSSVALAEGALALVLLAVLQLLAAWGTTRSRAVRTSLTSRPTVLLRDGRPLQDALDRQRVSLDSLHAAVRSAGIGGLELVAVVVLETNGGLSVVPADQAGSGSALPGAQDRTTAARSRGHRVEDGKSPPA